MMIELQTEVSLSVVESYLEKSPEQRTEKHSILVQEAMKILAEKQAQFSPKDQALFQQAKDAGL